MAITVSYTTFSDSMRLTSGGSVARARAFINGLVASSAASGLTINITASGGAITAGTISVAGTGYATGQLVVVTGGGGILGAFTVTAQSGGVPSAIALYSGGQGYSTTSSAATLSANTVPHGLGTTPQTVDLEPSAAGLWGTAVLADATNFYISVSSGGAAYGWVNVEYGAFVQL